MSSDIESPLDKPYYLSFFVGPRLCEPNEYALRLVAKGFETPAPIAYILLGRKGFGI